MHFSLVLSILGSKGHILPWFHPSLLRFAFGGEAYCTSTSFFPSSITPHIHGMHECSSGAAQTAGNSHSELPYNCLILVQMVAWHRYVVLSYMQKLGLRLDAKKSMFSPV